MTNALRFKRCALTTITLSAFYVLTAITLSALLAGCSGTQNGLSVAPSSVKQNVAHHVTSSSGDLLYIGDYVRDMVYIVTYPKGQLVSTISDLGSLFGMCSDSSGNVWIAYELSNKSSISEFSHGSTLPFKTLQAPSGAILTNCAVDKKTGTLSAVVSSTGVATWASGQGNPTLYHLPFVPWELTYDNGGNLFVDGYVDYGKSTPFVFDELKYNGKTFQSLKTNADVLFPGSIGWDGQHLVLGAQDSKKRPRVYQLRIQGPKASVIATLNFEDATSAPWFTLYKRTLIGPTRQEHYSNAVALWNYPAGGEPFSILSEYQDLSGLQAFSVAPAQSRIRK